MLSFVKTGRSLGDVAGKKQAREAQWLLVFSLCYDFNFNTKYLRRGGLGCFGLRVGRMLTGRGAEKNKSKNSIFNFTRSHC